MEAFPARAALAALLALGAACGKEAPAAGAQKRVEENPRYNFRFRAPRAWSRIEAGEIDPGATLAYARSRPDVTFLLYASRPGEEIGVARIVEDWKKQLGARAAGQVEVSSTPLTVNGVPGMRAVAVATVQSMKVAYENWIVERNGYSYQLVAWGNASDRSAIARDASELFSGFELIDPATRVEQPRRAAKPYTSADGGWSIDLGLPWLEWRAMRDRLPAAEYGAVCGDASLAVASVPLFGRRPPLDAMVDAMLPLLDIKPAVELPRRPLHAGAWSGYELPYERQIAGRWVRYRIHVLAGDDAALIAAEWRPPEQSENVCTDPLDRLSIDSGPRAPRNSVEPNPVAARFFSDVARRLRATGHAAESLAYFAQAGALAPDDASLLLEEIGLLQQLGRRDDASRRVAARLHGAECASPMRAQAAELLTEMGRGPEAIATWTSAFGCGYRDPAALSRYLDYLQREGRLTLAFREAQAFADPADLPRLRGQLAAATDRQ